MRESIIVIIFGW